MRITNYLKLSVRAAKPLHDAEAVQQLPSGSEFPLVPHSHPLNGDGGPRAFVTTWIFPFNDKSLASAHAALKAAQEKRVRMRTKHFELGPEAFQIASFAPCALRGVVVVGTPIRKIKIVEASTETLAPTGT